ncbi:VC0807 family protein [Amycolatopsis benzoatilytica]|uniref:VC0807 family protein n=1 Tax=Amycolatopsis benzoatilytica TaxID=346045 RepID=UPI0003A01553|nr:VC0807 family protein [Amycolatopsis benzoatilytica]
MTAPAAGQQRREGMRALVRQNGSTIVFDLVVPLGLYYGLRALGVSQWWALLAGILASIPRIVLGVWRARRLDLMAVFTISVMAFSLAIGLLTDSPRALAIREGWVGALLGLLGLWMVISVLVRRPVLMTLGRTIAVSKVGEAGARVWERRWQEDAGFRHGLRVMSVVWGLGLFLSSVASIVLTYLLPIDLINLVTSVQFYAILAALLGFHFYYTKKRDLRA